MYKNLKTERAQDMQKEQSIWHPLTQHKTHPGMIALRKAQGAVLTDMTGKEYIDGIASWYTSAYGHCHPYIIECVSQQMQQLDQVVFSSFTHQPALELSEELLKILPGNQQKLFFSDNGSTSVEVAIKMALQYWFNKGEKKSTLIAFKDGFHGDTFGAMSVSGLSVYNGAFKEYSLDVLRLSVPNADNYKEVVLQLEDWLKHNNVAAFIYEPLVQGAAAMKMHCPEHLDALLQVCHTYDVLCIADEVMTGFGKTGKNFASEYMSVQPDLICLSKALTAGLIPMAITTCTQDVYDAFYDDSVAKGFFHGHTYTANPLACAAALAGVRLLQSKDIKRQINKIAESHRRFSNRLQAYTYCKNVRQKGVILAFELDIPMERYGSLRNELYTFFMNNGVFLRPLGNTIYILPPFVITDHQLEKIYRLIEEAIRTFTTQYTKHKASVATDL